MIREFALFFDLLFFLVGLYLTGYNLLYANGMKKSARYIGFSLPKMVEQVVRLNIFLSIMALCVIGVFTILR